MKNRQLRKELLKEGASAAEAESLTRLATQLGAANPPGLSARAKQRMYDELSVNVRKQHRPAIRWAMAGSLAGAMALVALIVLPGLLQNPVVKPEPNDVRTLVQPVETKLQELDMQVEELQEQGTVDEAELKEAENHYQRTFENFKKRYENNREFQNYDWNKWKRNYYQRDSDNNQNTDTNDTSTTHRTNTYRYWDNR